MKPKTYHEGASDERRAILRKLRREMHQWGKWGPTAKDLTQAILSDLIDWLLQRNERYNARPGGLGRKRKAK